MVVVSTPPQPLDALGALVHPRWRLDVARATDAIHLTTDVDRIAGVLECVSADDKVKALVGERQRPAADVELMVRLGGDAEVAVAIAMRSSECGKRHDIDDVAGVPARGVPSADIEDACVGGTLTKGTE
jgi:hypothetical protein